MINKNIPEVMYELLNINKNYVLLGDYLNQERLDYLSKHRDLFNVTNR